MAAEADSRNRAEIAASRRRRRQLAPWRWLACLMRDQCGVSAVELGLTAAFILPPLGSVFDLGMAFSQEIKLQQAVQAARNTPRCVSGRAATRRPRLPVP